MWVKLDGLDGYELSDMGEIRSYHRVGYGKELDEIPHIITGSVGNNGYIGVILEYNGKTKRYSIHRLIAKAFIPNPENKKTVNHKNGIKTDNRVENLERATYKENNIHSLSVLGSNKGGHKGKIGVNNHRSKKVGRFDLLGNLIDIFYGCAEVERQLGINNRQISDCCRGKEKTCHGFIWKYI